MISFNGTAHDAKGRPLTDSSLVWTSSIDNQIGTGTDFALSSLSLGTHTITLTATDSDGLTDVYELYTSYTNPKIADTDNDGINDYWENNCGSDPNNWTESSGKMFGIAASHPSAPAKNASIGA